MGPVCAGSAWILITVPAFTGAEAVPEQLLGVVLESDVIDGKHVAIVLPVGTQEPVA
jgi:hypothetical protein